jgi:hypothetical protein
MDIVSGLKASVESNAMQKYSRRRKRDLENTRTLAFLSDRSEQSCIG